MALCKKGGLRAGCRGAASAAAAVSSWDEHRLAAVSSLFFAGSTRRAVALERFARGQSIPRKGHEASVLKGLLVSERNLCSLFLAFKTKAGVLFSPVFRFGGNGKPLQMRICSATPSTSYPAARRSCHNLRGSHSFGTYPAYVRAFSSAAAASRNGSCAPCFLVSDLHADVCGRFSTLKLPGHGSVSVAATAFCGSAAGLTNSLQQPLLQPLFTNSNKGQTFIGQMQVRKFAFPSLRFFVNNRGGPSGSVSEGEADASPTNGVVVPQQLRILEQQAESNIEDAQLQQRYLAALNAHGDSYRAVQHVEKHKDNLLGVSEGVLVEYVKALCSSGLIHQQGRSLPQIVQRYVTAGGKLGESGADSDAARAGSANSNLNFTLLHNQQRQQQLLLQQQLMVQMQQLVHQLQVEDVHRKTAAAAPLNSTVGAFSREGGRGEGHEAVAGGEFVKLVTAAAAGGKLSNVVAATAAAPLNKWRRFGPVRAVAWFCRGLWGLLKACNRGLWGLLLSPVVAVFLFWSFLSDGVQAVQNSVKNLEGNGGLGNQPGGKKASEWVAGKVVKPEEINTSFADVKGCEEVKKEVVEVVEYLKAPAKFTAMGARLPKGVLLQGPPGTGKTLLARAIAGEAGVPFIHASGSDFEEMYVGVGASRLRQLFAEARKRSPCILFIDEIDALGGRRTLTENKHHRQTLNQLLTELDGFKPSDGVTLICATNLAEALDPALTRPGRIDRIIHVPFPCKKERVEILQHYAMKMPLAEDVDLDLLASLTSGMTGADLANLLNFAAIRAATDGKEQVTLAEVEESFDRLMVGNRRSSVVMKEEERKVTAYHESGHALMCLYTPGSLPLHKATILFRGSALGVTWSVNREESFSKSLKEYLASLDVAMGGKAAEEIVFGKGNVTSGCSNDLQKATRVARTMVTGFGMGVDDSKAPMVVSGKEYSFLSDESKKKVDEAVQRLLDQSYDRARALLMEKRDELEKLAQALLEHETLSADEIRAAVTGSMDSAAIKERRRERALASQKPKQKVNTPGAEGEGEEEQQPPSALLRLNGEGPSVQSSPQEDTGGSEAAGQASITHPTIAGHKPDSSFLLRSAGTDCCSSEITTTPTILSDANETRCEIRGNNKREVFTEATDSDVTAETSPPSPRESTPCTTGAGCATATAVTPLWAAAAQEPLPKQPSETQRPNEATVKQEKAAPAMGEQSYPVIEDKDRIAMEATRRFLKGGQVDSKASVDHSHDRSNTEAPRLVVNKAEDKEKNPKMPSGSLESRHDQKAALPGGVVKADPTAEKRDRSGDSV